MKKWFFYLPVAASSLLLGTGLVSCNLSGSGSSSGDSSLWSDSGAITSVLSFDPSESSAADSKTPARSNARATSDNSKVYFRSSSVDFWSTTWTDFDKLSIPDGDTLENIDMSHTATDYTNGLSLSYCMGNTLESIVFSPTGNTVKSFGNTYNTNWTNNVTAFLTSSTSKKINLVRLDIGSGMVSFVVDGKKVRVFRSNQAAGTASDSELIDQIQNTIDAFKTKTTAADWDAGKRPRGYEGYPAYAEVMTELNEDLLVASGINANSIIFVDKTKLSKPVLVDLAMDKAMTAGTSTVTAADLGLTADEFTLITALTQKDISDGALFLPFTPLDLSTFNPSCQKLEIVFNWKIGSSIEKKDGNYFMTNRVTFTPFDFDVTLQIADK